MKNLKFKPHLVEQIINGTKTVTWRLFDEKDLKKGDIFEIIDVSTGESSGEAVIIETQEKRIKDVTISEFKDHGYKDANEMITSFRKYYGNKVNLDTMVKIVKFKLVKRL